MDIKIIDDDRVDCRTNIFESGVHYVNYYDTKTNKKFTGTELLSISIVFLFCQCEVYDNYVFLIVRLCQFMFIYVSTSFIYVS